MINQKLLIAGLAAIALSMSACSKKTEEAADKGNVETAAKSAGDDIIDGAKTTGAVATGAVVNTGEAIADGTSAVVDDVATATANGANNVADGAKDIAVSTPETVDLQADPNVVEAVDEDQQY